MRRYLLAAEADKIQDFIFRSSRLREVVGGSQLLSRFCREGAFQLLKRCVEKTEQEVKKDIIVADGGSFRVVFDNPEICREFGHNLAILYRQITGGSLSVAEPVPYETGGFHQANKAAHAELRRAKLSSRGATGTPPPSIYSLL